MSRICQLTGKSGLVGNRVSHSNMKSKRKSLPNLQSKRFWSDEKKAFVSLKVSTSAMRTIDKLGLDAFCRKMKVKI
jgi:large subunit ribosomal protein L28